VVTVDCNPAQSALIELKKAAIQRLPFEDVWALFGEGRHPRFEHLFLTQLGPHMSEKSYRFWQQRCGRGVAGCEDSRSMRAACGSGRALARHLTDARACAARLRRQCRDTRPADHSASSPRLPRRTHYFQQGLYYQGGMGKLCHVMHVLCRLTGHSAFKQALCEARDLEEQRRLWHAFWLVRFLRSGSGVIVRLFIWLASLVFLNKLVLWYGGGVPAKQFELIQADKARVGG